jgi:hypothetical protein
MRRQKRAIRGVALLTQWVKPLNTGKAYVFKPINTVHSGQLRILGSSVATSRRRQELRLTGELVLHPSFSMKFP